jgi:hypothetical protein
MNKSSVEIRPLQYRDLESLNHLSTSIANPEISQLFKKLGHWYGAIKLLSLIPNPCQHDFSVIVAEKDHQMAGMLQVSPINRTLSTWKIEWMMVNKNVDTPQDIADRSDIGSQLLRYCFEQIIDATTWVSEAEVNDPSVLALYRQNGFQPLAQLTYWQISPEVLTALAKKEPDLPNLLPVRNADAQLIYQLDTVSMPPIVRQVFDRQVHDFKLGIIEQTFRKVKHWFNQTEPITNYVFEPQRKAAIGYYDIHLHRQNSQPHQAQLTVHPAYTWLYPELLSQMAIICQNFPHQPLELVSTDYQPEREEFLQSIGAQAIKRTLLMSRSVWHKLREGKNITLEGLQLGDVLSGLNPVRQPAHSRLEWSQFADIIDDSNKYHQ